MTKQELVIENRNLKAEILALKHELSLLKKIVFGRTTDHRPKPANASVQKNQSDQTQMEAAAQPEPKKWSKKHSKKTKPTKRKKSCGRQAFSANLVREVKEILPEDYDPETMKIISQDETELLAYREAELYVIKIVRPKVVVKQDDGSTAILQAPMPERLLSKGMVDESLIVELLVDKALFHTPIYRFGKKLKQSGVRISHTVLLNLFHAGIEHLLPVYHLMHQDLLKQTYLQVDESTIKVLPKKTEEACKIGYMWVMNAPELKASLFHFGPGRSQQEALKLIGKYSGKIQADGYKVYKSLQEKLGFILMHCMAHCRRKFIDSMNLDLTRAEEILTKIDKLYDIERKAREKNYCHEKRLELRQKKAVRILKKIEKWLNKQVQKPSHQILTPFEKAIAYAHLRWSGLSAYAYDGRVEIDNNLVENAIRPLALGRKNYLFAGNEHTAQNLAVLYYLVGTAEKNQLDVKKYLLWLSNKIINNKVTGETINWLPYRLDPEIKAQLSTENNSNNSSC